MLGPDRTEVSKNISLDTKLVHVGSRPAEQQGFVNPPLYRGSTALYTTVAEMKESTSNSLRKKIPAYGRFGTPTSRAFEEAMTELEGGFDAISTGSGLAAITTAILAFVESGDHILVTDSVYQPTRNFCESLGRMGIETEYYDPGIGAAIVAKFRPNTRFVFLESPGSNTFEVQDVPAIARACQTAGILTLIDNTWATPLFFRPLLYGVDVVVHSATKYITGHSDSFLGVIVANEKTFGPLRSSAIRMGQSAGADDTYFGLRGLRTLATRLHQHERQALSLAEWLGDRPEVGSVLHPALPEHPGHALWKRDFTGSTGLFGVSLKPKYEMSNVHSMVEGLNLFGLGHGWGGFESLIVPVESHRFLREGPLLRIHVGLENIDDLKADLLQGLNSLS